MKRFIVTVEETISEDFEVYAENENEAFEITKIIIEMGHLFYSLATLLSGK